MEAHGQHQIRKTHTRQEEEEGEEEEEEEEIYNIQTEIYNNSNNETIIQESKQQLKRELTVNASKQKAASIIRAQQREARSKHIQRQFSGAARRALEQSRSIGHQRDTRTNTTQDDAVEPLLQAEGGTEEQRKQGENTNNARDGDGENDENEMRMDKRRRNDGGGYDADEIEVSIWTKNGKRVWYDMRGDARGIWNVVTGSRVNALLIVVPFGMASKLAGWNPLAVFWLNFVSIIPLAWLLGQATEDIALWTGDVFGGLINATLGNVVEIIIGIAALNQDLITIIQTSLLGSIFSNMLLVLGTCFLLGGIINGPQRFDVSTVQIFGPILFLSSMGVVLPTIFATFERNGKEELGGGGGDGDGDESSDKVKIVSYATAIILALSYALYLFYELRKHGGGESAQSTAAADTNMRDASSSSSATTGIEFGAMEYAEMEEGRRGHKQGVVVVKANGSGTLSDTSPPSALHTGDTAAASTTQMPPAMEQTQDTPEEEDVNEEEHEEPEMSVIGSSALLLVATSCVAVNSEFLVDSIQYVSAQWHVSQDFIGIILLPIVGNAAEHITAVIVAARNKMDLAIAVALGSSIQIALFAVPLMVILGWIKDLEVPMTLDFGPLNAVTFFLGVVIVHVVVSNGRSNWLKGSLLLGAYLIIAIGYAFTS